ncbi:MAG: 16S ribosomal RNA methyltransferase A [Methanobacterium sp.]|nr:16S ribosomal RNA methyltransferase A [Methanobacterium sp.]
MLTETLEILKKNNIKLNKRKGQNYLINKQVLQKILEYADLSLEDTILEVGPGIGTLTIPMARQSKKIIAVEQDHKIASILKKRLRKLNITNVEVITADAVKINFPEFNKVISNLPYQISSPITFKILKYNFDFAILMYQLEYAHRMTAKPGDSNYSRLSLMVYNCADVELLFEVPPENFHPIPQISSAVLKLSPHKKANIDQFFIKVSRALFQHKKKKTKNALKDSFHEICNYDRNTAKEIIQKLDKKIADKRVIQLDPAEVMEISHQLKQLLKEQDLK